MAATSATTPGVAFVLMQVEILPNGPRYRNHYMETNPPSLLIGVCIHTREMENHLTQTKWNVCKCVASHVYVLRGHCPNTKTRVSVFMRSNSCLICSLGSLPSLILKYGNIFPMNKALTGGRYWCNATCRTGWRRRRWWRQRRPPDTRTNTKNHQNDEPNH